MKNLNKNQKLFLLGALIVVLILVFAVNFTKLKNNDAVITPDVVVVPHKEKVAIPIRNTVSTAVSVVAPDNTVE